LVDPVKIARTIKAAKKAVDPLFVPRASALAAPEIQSDAARRVALNVAKVGDYWGEEHARRLIKAQDEGADLSYYTQRALETAVNPEQGHLLTTIDPKTFQDYAFRIDPDRLRENPYQLANEFSSQGLVGSLNQVLNNYGDVAKQGNWSEVPRLSFGLTPEQGRYGWHPNDMTQTALPRTTRHEGRHRMMTMAGPLGDNVSLVGIRPDDPSSILQQLPAGERAKVLRDMLEKEGSGRVIPQYSNTFEPLASRGFQDEQDFPRLPETWAEGGGVPGFHSDYGTPTFDVPLGDGKGTAGFSYDPTAQIVDALLGYEHPIGKQGARLGASGSFNKYVGPGGDQAKPHWGAGLRLTVPFADGGAVPHMNELGLVKKGIEAAKGALSRPIRTYTGSPYKFDKFDPSFIGKGEGSAAYGHGFYSAENPQVGQEYRRITGDKSEEPGRWTRYGAPVDRLGMNSMMEALIKQHVDLDDPGRTEMLARYLQNNLAGGSTPEEIAAKLGNTYGGSKTGQEFDPDQIKRTIAGIPPFYKPQKPGWLYHLDINSHPDNFLDWDAPLDKGGNRRIMDRVHPNVADSIGEHLDYEGLNSPWDAPDGYTGRDLHHFLMQPGPQGVMSDAFYDDSAKKMTANYLSDLDVHGVRFLDKFSRQQQRFPFAGPMEDDPGRTRNYVVFPQSSDLIDIVNREKAEGGRVQHFDVGGQPDAEGGGALSQLAAINPLKLINFFNKGALKESLDPSVQKGVERVLKHVDETGNEALVHGRYGDDLAKPYTGRMLPGDKGSVRLTGTVKKNLWANAPGQPWSVHPHPDMDAPFGLPKVPWSNMPSEGDIYSSYLPKNMWSSFGNLPEMLVANQHGNLVRLGGVHNAWDEGAGYSQRRDVAQHIGSIFDQKSRFGATSDESKAMEDAYADWAKAHGLADYKPRVPILHPKTGAVAAAWNPASLDLATVPSLARLSEMGVPVDVQGNLSGYPNFSLKDAMTSWADYLERKTGNPLKDSDPAQLDFNFGKAEGGMIRNYAFGGFGLPADDSQDVGDTDVTQDQEGGALSQVGYRPTGGALSRRIAAALEEEKRLNALRGPKAAPIYLPPDPKIQTVTNPERMAFAGIYKPPAQIIAEAKARYDEGDEQAMRRLFSVDRQSLDDLSQSRNHSNLFMQPHAYYPPPGATGSAISDKVLTPSNMNRITNVAEAALDDPQLRLTRSWYEMQPLWDRMDQLGMSPEYQRMFNTRVGLHSAGASPRSEINRGTSANWLAEAGRLGDYIDLAGVPEHQRVSMGNYPEDMLQIPGHAYHSTAHSKPLINLEASGQLWTDRHKVPTYVQATDPVLADPRRPIADAHLARGVGYSDVRTGSADNLFKELTTPEYGDFVPWWQRASEKVGMQPRDMQAMIWNTLGPQTGVRYIGPSKLEMMSGQIMRTAARLGVSPETARDLVLTGKAGAYAEGGPVQGLQEGGDPDYGTFPRTRKVADLGIDALADLPEKEEMWRRNQTWKDWDKSFPERLDDKFKSSREVFLRNLLPSDLIAKLRATDRWVGGGFGKDATFAQLASEELGKLNMAGDDISPYQRGAVGALSHTAPFLGPAKFRQGVGLGYGAGTAFNSLTDQKHDTLQSWLAHFMPDFKPYVAGAEKVGGGLAADLGEALTRSGADPSGAAYYASGGSTDRSSGSSVNDDIMSFLKGIVPGATDAFGDMPDIARHAPPPLSFMQPQAAQASSGTSSSPLDSIFNMANAGKSLLGGKGSPVSASGPVGSGPGGSYTTGDLNSTGGLGGLPGGMDPGSLGGGDTGGADAIMGLFEARGGYIPGFADGGSSTGSNFTVPGKSLIDVMQAGDGVDKGLSLADPTGASTGDNGGRDLAPLQFMQPAKQQSSGGGGGAGQAIGQIADLALKVLPMFLAGGGKVDDEMLNYGTMFYDEGGYVPGFAGGGISDLMGSVGGGSGGIWNEGGAQGADASGMAGLPIMGWMGDAASLTKHIAGGPGQSETESGAYPMDPGSGIWDALSGDKPSNLDQGELIGRDAGRAVGRGVSMLFGGVGSGAFAEGFGRLGEGVGAMVQGHFGEGFGDLARGTPLQLVLKSATGGQVPRGALRYCNGGRY
jgi:hypothetical protein